MGLLIVVAIAAAICFIISNIVKKKSEDMGIGFWALSIFGLIVIGVLLIIAGVARLANNQTRHRYQATYDNLIARVERCDQSDTMLWHDVQEYNEDVVNGKYWRNSFWTNIYNEKCILEFNEIEISTNLEELHERETVEESVQE